MYYPITKKLNSISVLSTREAPVLLTKKKFQPVMVTLNVCTSIA